MSGEYTGSKWGLPGYGQAGGQVTWSFGSLSSILMTFDQTITALPFQASIRAAFDLWESVANIDFVEVADSMASDIRLAWDQFDGPGGTLATAIWQYSGTTTLYSEIGFDLAESWRASANYAGGGHDFYAVAVHEIGHAIGLAHVDDSGSIMYPYLSSQTGPSAADVQAIQALYGPAQLLVPTAPVAPTPVSPVVPSQADQLYGQSLDDVLSGGFGNDTISGGAGDDMLFGNQDDDLIYGGAGQDTLYGGQHRDTLHGEDGDDQLFGNLGDDALFGNVGNDYAHGGQGADTLHGGQGSDTLNGGAGDDMLTGGFGMDVFVFASQQGNDVVTDFSRTQGDVLDLSGQSYAAVGDGADTLLTLSGGGSIRLLGVSVGDLDPGAFV